MLLMTKINPVIQIQMIQITKAANLLRKNMIMILLIQLMKEIQITRNYG